MQKAVRKHGDQRVKFHIRGSRFPSGSQLLPVDGENGGAIIRSATAVPPALDALARHRSNHGSAAGVDGCSYDRGWSRKVKHNSISVEHLLCRSGLLAFTLLTLFATACNPPRTQFPVSPPTRMDTPALAAVTRSTLPLTTPVNRPTIQLAEAYLSAMINSDQTSLDRILGADAWCTTSDGSAIIKKHIEEFRLAQIRNLRIEELDITGWVAYPPGSEAASISFEYQAMDSQGWSSAKMIVVTAQSPVTKSRFICNVTD